MTETSTVRWLSRAIPLSFIGKEPRQALWPGSRPWETGGNRGNHWDHRRPIHRGTGAQLTRRTFHIGGAASRRAEKNVISTDLKGLLEFSSDARLVKTINNELVVMSRKGELILRDENNLPREKHDLSYGARLNPNPNGRF
jgi:hypothetical protein